MKVFSGKNLHYKFIGYFILSAVIFIGILSFIIFHVEINHANDKAEIKINQLMDAVENNVAIAVYTHDPAIATALIKESVTGLLHNDVVHKVAITGDNGFFFEQSRGNPAQDQKEVIRELFSPFGNTKSIGQLSITPEADFSQNEAQHVATSFIINAFILVALVSLSLLLIIHTLFAQPLTRISDTLRDINAGEQERIEPLENNKNDEIGRLVVSINKILDELNTKLSTQRSLRKRVELVEKKLRNIFESTSAGLFLLDSEGNVLTCTPTLQKILGFEDTNLVSINKQNFATLFFEEPSQFQQMIKSAQELEQLEAQDLMLKNDNQKNPVWVHCLLSRINDATTGDMRFEGVIFDISKRVANEKAILYEANHDALTGLLRRNAAELQLRKHLSSEKNPSTIVLLLDLDGFKKANDTYGHDVGDLVLIETAKRLESCVRHNDIVCRLGGDEFLIILFNCPHIKTGFGIAEQIIASIQMPVSIDNQKSVNIGVSIGIASFPGHGSNVEELLKSADEAMYEVKRKGKNGYGIKNKNDTFAVNRPFAHDGIQKRSL